MIYYQARKNYFPPLNNFLLWIVSLFLAKRKTSFRGNYTPKYGISSQTLQIMNSKWQRNFTIKENLPPKIATNPAPSIMFCFLLLENRSAIWRSRPEVWERNDAVSTGIYRLWIFCNRPIKLIGLQDNMQSADCRSRYRFFKDSIVKTAWESAWHFIIFLSSKLSVHFTHWKEAKVINNDYLINKRICTFFTMKKDMPYN